MFVADGIDEPRPIASMPGVVQHTRDSLRKAAAEAVAAGVGGLMLFGVPRDEDKDAIGFGGVAEDGILNVALRDLAKDLGDDTVLMADTCLDEFTDHGHCGVLDASGRVDNDATNARYVELAVAQADSGAHVVGPSGMMDGQVAAIRDGAGRGRAHRRGDPGVRRQVRLGVLRPVPRGGGLQPERGSPDLPAGSGQRPRGACTRSNSTSPRAPTS